jgi:hypothetical protein
MMSAFVAFLLVVTIFIGILAVIFDPTHSITKYMEGKTGIIDKSVGEKCTSD